MQRQERSPKQKCQSQNWPTFPQYAGPFALSEKKSWTANQDAAADVCANTHSITKQRKFVDVTQTLRKIAEDASDHSFSDGSVGRFRGIDETIGNNVDAFLKNWKSGDNQCRDDDDE